MEALLIDDSSREILADSYVDKIDRGFPYSHPCTDQKVSGGHHTRCTVLQPSLGNPALSRFEVQSVQVGAGSPSDITIPKLGPVC